MLSMQVFARPPVCTPPCSRQWTKEVGGYLQILGSASNFFTALNSNIIPMPRASIPFFCSSHSPKSLSRQIFPGLSERDLRAEVDTDNLFDVPIGTRVRPEKRAGWQPPTSLPQMVKPGSGKWFNGCTAAGQ